MVARLVSETRDFLGFLSSVLTDFLFPKECFGCGFARIFLCDTCAQKITFYNSLRCAVCGRYYSVKYFTVLSHNLCLPCGEKFALDGLGVALSYDDLLVRRLIHALKYDLVEEIAPIVAGFMIDTIRAFPKSAIIVPVPLHRRKLLSRGFNQSERIAQSLGDVLGFRVNASLLRRDSASTPQAQLSRADRLVNILPSSFSFHGVQPIPRVAILVDDVITTGTTLAACAKILKQNGVHKVYAVVVAKG